MRNLKFLRDGLCRQLTHTAVILFFLTAVPAFAKTSHLTRTYQGGPVYQLQSLSVGGVSKNISGQQIQAQLKSSSSAPVSGTLCDSNCQNQLQLLNSNGTGSFNKSSLCQSAQALFAQMQTSASFGNALNAICASNSYSQSVQNLVTAALNDPDVISKSNQGQLDVQSGNVTMQFAPTSSSEQTSATSSSNSAANSSSNSNSQAPQAQQCAAGQFLGEDGQCHVPSAPACPTGQAISEADGKCHVISTSNSCPAGQAIFESDGKCHPIPAPTTGPSES